MEKIFVFGSNEAGYHGKGAAAHARLFWGAWPGVGVGRTGQAYAIPTKDAQLKSLPLSKIKNNIHNFLIYAYTHKELTFLVTPIGTGFAGYTRKQIGNLFTVHSDLLKLTPNVVFTKEWFSEGNWWDG